ncbi:RnfH family protein [Halioxenophilus sp. WMMB6]|uniref:RnfH family protein n=1 Tax=Halioxenophilus sp. WMMB6 TaxID=3073815 RepID=UPI00295EFF1C|nr:RnfH family protein [Halioxenophilus sp. WMMB6]
MKVSVAFANEHAQVWRTYDVAEGTTVEDVLNQSGLISDFGLDVKKQKVGIFGKFTKLTAPVSEGDRIEIYDPITRVLDEDDDDDDD